ncbi:hypothetical protein KAU19_08140, partial [Candidatus Parcubacteria bacterium]|nr:hypothetical protein [Candidatus Parcubacteria bacterium]
MTKKTKEKISSPFQFNGLILGTDLIWRLKLKLNNVVPESWKYCKIKFVYDDTELQGQISEKSDDLKQCKKNPTLWEEENYGSQKAIEQEITSLKKDLEERQDTVKEMSFDAEIEQISYKDG